MHSIDKGEPARNHITRSEYHETKADETKADETKEDETKAARNYGPANCEKRELPRDLFSDSLHSMT